MPPVDEIAVEGGAVVESKSCSQHWALVNRMHMPPLREPSAPRKRARPRNDHLHPVQHLELALPLSTAISIMLPHRRMVLVALRAS